MQRYFSWLAILFGVILLSSCIDGDEEYWLYENGSGKLQIKYKLPEMMLRAAGGEVKILQEIQKLFSSDKGFLLTSCDVGKDTIAISATFENAGKFTELFSNNNGDDKNELELLLGKFSLQKRLNHVDLLREIHLEKELSGLGLFSSKNETHNLHYTIHLPIKPTMHNAHSTADDGQTLVWNFPLTQAVSQPIVMSFSATLPIPAWCYYALAAFLFLLVILIAKLFFKNARRQE